MDIYEGLQEAGLTGNEAKAYLELLRKGELSANQIAKNISMDRTLAYTVLNHLIEKGQVNYSIKGSKKYFSISNPMNLLNSLKKKEILVSDLISELKKIKKTEEVRQEINIYEGKDGLRTFYRFFFKYKIFYAFGVTGGAYDILYDAPFLSRELIKKGVKAKIITHLKNKNHPITKLSGVESRYLDINSGATTTIFGDYVSIHIINDRPLIILIKNKEIANTYKNHFEVLWKIARH